MAQVLTLSDGISEVSFYDLANDAILASGSTLDAANGKIDLHVSVGFNNTLTLNQLEAQANKIRQLLHNAAVFYRRGLGRRVTLTAQPDTLTAATTFYVRGGSLDLPSPWQFEYLAHHEYDDCHLILEVEPYGASAETAIVTAATLRSQVGLTHAYLAYTGGTVFSANMAPVLDGSMWQSNTFTASPTVQTPATSDVWYFGHSTAAAAEFDRVVMGLRTAGAGTYTVQWSYWNGSAWTNFTPAADPFNSFKIAVRLGAITFPALTGFAATTVNTVSALWVRAVFTLGTMTTVPVRCNGLGSTAGLATLPSASIPGDLPADALVHLTNPGATALAGVRAALVADLLGTGAPPPAAIDFQAADLFIATGDNTVAVVADANAEYGNRVEVTLGAAISDAAQYFTGGIYGSATVGAADKLGVLGASSFFCEVIFRLRTLPTGPIGLAGQWSGTLSTSSWWLGVDPTGGAQQLSAVASNSSSNRRTAPGSTTLQALTWYVATLEFDQSAQRLRLYINTGLQYEQNVSKNALRNGQTTAFEVAGQAGFGTGDSRSGSDTAVNSDVEIRSVFIVAKTLKDFWRTQLGSSEDYPYPDGSGAVGTLKRSTYAALASVVLLWDMQDNLATTALVDSASATTLKPGARSSGNTNAAANRVSGYFQSGQSAPTRILGQRLPQAFGEEYAGSYRAYLFASPENDTTLVTATDVEFLLQFSVGDVNLNYQASGIFFPDTKAPIALGTPGYYCLDCGPVTLPPAAMYDGHRGSGSARNQLQFNLFMRSNLSGKKIFLDRLLLLPTEPWQGGWDAWRAIRQTTYEIAQNAGVFWDATGPRPAVSQALAGGYSGAAVGPVQDRNPYGRPRGAAAPRLEPGIAHWLLGVPLRGFAGTQGPAMYAVLADTMSARVQVMARWLALAAS